MKESRNDSLTSGNNREREMIMLGEKLSAPLRDANQIRY